MEGLSEQLGLTLPMLINPLLALVFGAIVGLNRELKGRAAGLRTHALVSLGACVFTMAALRLCVEHPDSNFDPIRVVSGVVGGIGFLGAGSIMQSRGSITGITTAATIWLSGAFGITCGIGWYQMGFVALFLCVVSLLGLDALKRMLGDEDATGQQA